MIRQSYQLLGFAFLAIIVSIYYGLGAERFPDYDNYITIATNKGWLFSEDEYVFEWISRGLLTIPLQFGLKPSTAVDLLALINQSVCVAYFAWLLTSRDRARNYGGALLLSLVGVLLMTTTLRATTAYIALSWFVLRGMKLDIQGLCILMLGLAWHDSFILPAALAFFSHASLLVSKVWPQRPIGRLMQDNRLDQLLVWVALSFLLLAAPLRDAALAVLNIDLGIRSIYLEGDGAQNLAKLAYCGICQLMCLATVTDENIAKPIRRFAALLAVSVALMYLVSGVVAVRLAVFGFCALVPLRGVFFLNAERSDLARAAMLLVAPLLMAASVMDIMSQTL